MEPSACGGLIDGMRGLEPNAPYPSSLDPSLPIDKWTVFGMRVQPGIQVVIQYPLNHRFLQ